MTDKLTPRVGDRVLTVGEGGKTFVGDLIDGPGRDNVWTLMVDGFTRPWRRYVEDITVVDREPVEWPEGWENCAKETHYAYHEPSDSVVNRKELAHLLETGPDMLARWDELMGES